MLRPLGRILWIATTPLALTLLLATPARSDAQTHGAAPTHEATGGAHGVGEHGGGHAVLENPIQNFKDINYRDRDAHGGTYEVGEEKMPPPFLAALTNFLVLLFLVGKFAAPSFRNFVRARHDQIASQLAESAKLRDEAKRRLEEYGEKIATLQGEIDRIVSEIRAEAEAEKGRILSEAQARAARMKRDAEQQIQAEMARVRATLEREAALAAVAMAEQILREKMNDADQKTLAEKFATNLNAAAAQAAGPRSRA